MARPTLKQAKEKKRVIKQLISYGFSIHEMGRLLSISAVSVHEFLHRHNLKTQYMERTTKKTLPSPEYADKLAEQYDSKT